MACLTKTLDGIIPFQDILYTLEDQPHFCLFDSSLVDKSHGRYSVLLMDPFTVVQGSSLDDWQRFKAIYRTCADLFDALKEEMPFHPGAAGLIGYDFGLRFEDIDPVQEDDLQLPGFVLGLYDVAVIYDHVDSQVTVYSSGLPQTDPKQREAWANHRLHETIDLLKEAPVAPVDWGSAPKLMLRPTVTQKAYEQSVSDALGHIAAGDIYQVNLSQRFEGLRKQKWSFKEVVDLYLRLRDVSPACFAGFCRADNAYVLSSSPESLLQLRGREVKTRPMKGTRPRGVSADEDEQFSAALMNSEKDKAELLMITDLLRNDLGRVCDFGSVQVQALRDLEAYQTVYQTTSTVVGRLSTKLDVFDLIEAAFPGGSITGCPKIRSMKLINKLEVKRRHFYTGSLTHIGFNGDLDLNILIRTLTVKDTRVYFHVGGGVVADSDPAQEYEETLVKARAMVEALGIKEWRRG